MNKKLLWIVLALALVLVALWPQPEFSPYFTEEEDYIPGPGPGMWLVRNGPCADIYYTGLLTAFQTQRCGGLGPKWEALFGWKPRSSSRQSLVLEVVGGASWRIGLRPFRGAVANYLVLFWEEESPHIPPGSSRLTLAWWALNVGPCREISLITGSSGARISRCGN